MKKKWNYHSNMKQETNDIILNITTEWEAFTVRLNWDSDSSTIIRHFANLMRNMTFTTQSVVDSLREIADEFENDMKNYNDKNEILDYGATN